jgi:CubicO group peptidase (beta-lactamase class C family)
VKLRPGMPDEVGMSARRVERLKTLAADWVDQGIVSGLVVLVARKGVIVLQEAFGRIAPDRNEPPAWDTLFGLGSASTLITITAAMALVEDGVLAPNRPVSSYLPEFVGPGKDRILVHHLLAHTSGLRDSEVGWPHNAGAPKSESRSPAKSIQHPAISEYLHLVCNTQVHRPPDSEMSYGHCTIELVGEIVRRVSGQTLPQYAKERLFDPLGMKDTSFTVPASQRHRIIQRPPNAPFAELTAQVERSEVPWAMFSAFSSPRDMATFGQMFLNRGRYGDTQVLSPATVTEMTRNQTEGLAADFLGEHFPDASWGYGWNLHGHKRALGDGTLQSPQAFYQGNAGGVILWVDPTYELVGVYCGAVLKLIREEWPGDLFMNAVTAAIVDA